MTTPPKIALLVPDMPGHDEISPWLRRIDTHRWYTNFGPLNTEFEEALRESFGEAGVAVTTVANATLALELALRALGLPAGARVLIPGLTFVATAGAVLNAGMRPVIADIDFASWLLTPEIARAALEHGPIDAVMPVATFGAAQDVDGWDRFAQETGLPVVIDAAGAFGNQRAGRLATAVFSLHATKSLGIGEGGFIASRDPRLIARVRKLSNFGIENYIVEESGTNAKLSEYHAAVGLAALLRWPGVRERRIALARRYSARLRHIPATEQARLADGVYTIFPILLPTREAADRVVADLTARAIETRRWYCPPLHQHPAFAGLARAGALKNVELVAERLVGLPFHLALAETQIEAVAQRLEACLAVQSQAV